MEAETDSTPESGVVVSLEMELLEAYADYLCMSSGGSKFHIPRALLEDTPVKMPGACG